MARLENWNRRSEQAYIAWMVSVETILLQDYVSKWAALGWMIFLLLCW